MPSFSLCAFPAPVLQSLLSALDRATLWVCKQRRDYPADADIWDLRFHWHTEDTVASKLQSGKCSNQAIERTAERGGLYWDIRVGISPGAAP